MKKILILLLTTVSFAAQGQWLVGVNASFNRLGEKRNQSNANTFTYTLAPTLNVGYRIGSHLSTGVSANVNYITSVTKRRNVMSPASALYDLYEETTYRATQYLNWRAGLWLRYDLPLTEHLLLFAHLNLAGGSDYQRGVSEETYYNTQTQQMVTRHTENSYYGNASRQLLGFNADITPGVAYRFGSHWTAELWLDILKIAYTQNWEKTVNKAAAETYPSDSKAGYTTVKTLSSLTFGQQPLYGLYFYDDVPSSGMLNSSLRLGVTYNF